MKSVFRFLLKKSSLLSCYNLQALDDNIDMNQTIDENEDGEERHFEADEMIANLRALVRKIRKSCTRSNI